MNVWIVKVGSQYLAWQDGGSGRCSKKQSRALRFTSEGKAYRAAIRWGTSDCDDELYDDESDKARVVRLTRRRRDGGAG